MRRRADWRRTEPTPSLRARRALRPIPRSRQTAGGRGCRRPRGEAGAGGKADEIVRVRQLAQFVEIVDAPDQTPLGVPPGAEVLDVQIADGQTARRIGEGAAEQRPALNPPVEGGAQEHERTL